MQVFKKKQLLKEEELAYLCRLLETGLPIQECFSLLKDRKNEEIFRSILERLDKGELIEKIIAAYLPKDILDHFEGMIAHMSFHSALALALDFARHDRKNRDELVSCLAYPLVLLFITMSAMYLFDLYGLDMIFSMISSFSFDLGFYRLLRIILRTVIEGTYYLFLIFTALFVYYLHPKRIVILYLRFTRHFPDSLLNIFYSRQFMNMYLICCRSGYKSRKSLQILKAMKSKPVISFLAFHLNEALSEGESLKDAFRKDIYDSAVSRFIRIGNYTNDFENILETYLKTAQMKIERRLKTYTATIQVFTYSFIGAIVIFIYQILLMPMKAIAAY